MKLWSVAAVGVIAVFFAFTIAVSSGSSGTSSSPTPAAADHLSPSPATTGTPLSCGDKTCVPTAPTPTAPATCGFGIWEQCAKTAIEPVFDDFLSRFNIPRGAELAAVIEERIDWPDSCLGVDTPGVFCLQVITPGFRFVVTGGPDTPYAEYHTDLNGHGVFVAAYDTYQDVPPTQTPKP